MYKYFIQGLLIALAYLAPIGMQNSYVINTAISMSRFRAYQVAFFTFLFDISLALASFFGISILIERFPILKNGFIIIGSIVIILIGVLLLRSKPTVNTSINVNLPLYKIIGACFAITWFNPQAIIDGSFLFGGIRASLSASASTIFIIGVMSASFLWFFGLVTLVSSLKHIFGYKSLRVINILCGLTIIFFGIKLAYDFVIQFI